MEESDRRGRNNCGAEMSEDLALGRDFSAKRAWADAYHALSRADVQAALDAEDLDCLAQSAYLVGRDEDFLNALDRAYEAYLESNQTTCAARCGFWLGLTLLFQGEIGRGNGWLASARRLIEQAGIDCVEQGYLLLPVAEQRLGAKEFIAAEAAAAEAIAVGERFAEADLVACARHVQGRVLMEMGQVEAGLELLDEAMIPVTKGALSPVMTGLIYCSVIDACQQVYAVARAREWTTALARWCDDQPQMVAFTGTCLVHRAEIMQMHGAWQDAIAEVERACRRAGEAAGHKPPATAYYRRAEVYRLQGDFAAAEEAYRMASQQGFEPQPGLALLRMVQGETEKAVVAIRRVMAETTDPLRRTGILTAYVETMLKIGELEEARRASTELETIATGFDTAVLRAMAAEARGAVELAAGNAEAALSPLRCAFETWQAVAAPYEAARARLLLGLARRAYGDEEGAEMELDAAAAAFERLGAAPDLARVAALARRRGKQRPPGGLTPRELQVLRLVTKGMTNKAVARELRLSEKTVDRHLSNIFNKLDVPTRAAATAYAYEHKLL
jgi:DNA-binding NarL/FixJ family response regulator